MQNMIFLQLSLNNAVNMFLHKGSKNRCSRYPDPRVGHRIPFRTEVYSIQPGTLWVLGQDSRPPRILVAQVLLITCVILLRSQVMTDVASRAIQAIMVTDI